MIVIHILVILSEIVTIKCKNLLINKYRAARLEGIRKVKTYFLKIKTKFIKHKLQIQKCFENLQTFGRAYPKETIFTNALSLYFKKPDENFLVKQNARINQSNLSLKSKIINLVSKYRTNRDTISLVINKNQTNLLIDSGADVSLIKSKYVQTTQINQAEILSLAGIGRGTEITLGTINIQIPLDENKCIQHQFHVVKDNFPIAENGIIGRDFLKKYKADILYSSNQIKIGNHFLSFSRLQQNSIVLPKRSETIIEIETPTDDTYICNATKIQTGVYIPHMIVKPTNLKTKILIANTSTEEVVLNNFHPHLEKYIANNETKTKTNTDREEQIIQSIADNLDRTNNVEENMSVLSLCLKYQDIFFLEGEQLTSIPGVKHDITLYTDSKPVHVQRYRLPQTHKEEINKQVHEMLNDGRIKKSISPYNSPLLVVPKKPGKDGKPKWRVVVDFRKLNEVTIGDSFPLPNINDILDQLGHAQYFSTLDMASGYHQIEMNPQDSHKTAFSTDYGHFEFVRMPFGLKNSQSTFQRAMNHILSGFQGLKGFIYLDDVIIHGKNLKDHNEKLEELFEICRINNLKLQCAKCQFLRKEITFLGHQITPTGIKPNPTTVEAVQNFPAPRNVKETQSFLGLANYYRRFIPCFSEIAEPLTKLTRKGTTFQFSDECEKAMQTLKNCLTNPPVLKYPDFQRPFTLTTDASNHSLGAVLSQSYPTGDFPVAYASRTLGKSEKNYSTIEKEMLAIYWAVNNFRPYLYGRKFSVITDHKPLTGNLTKTPNRVLKWSLKLSEYDYETIYKSGKLNTNADALSRIKHDQILVLTRAQNKQTKQSSDKTQNTSKTQINTDIIPTTPNTSKVETVLDPSKRLQILEEYHNLPLGGHAGTWRTYKRIRMLYYWSNMITDINRYIRKCHQCKRNKTHKRTKVPLQITTTSEYPFQRVAFDIVGPLPTTENLNSYIFTFQDDLSKFSGAIPIPNQTANTVAKALCEYFITKYGIPEKILTDQGSNFISKSFGEICKLLKLKHITTTAYHPETNGALEKSHNTLKEYLRSFTDVDRNNWDEMCHYAMFVYNTTPHCATNYTPYELVYGRPALIPSVIKKEPEPIYNFDDYASELKAKLRLAHAVARQRLINKEHVTKQYYDRNINKIELQPNDYVWLKNEMRRNKQDPLWTGPYKVITVNSPTNTTIQINKKQIKVHNNRLIKQTT